MHQREEFGEFRRRSWFSLALLSAAYEQHYVHRDHLKSVSLFEINLKMQNFLFEFLISMPSPIHCRQRRQSNLLLLDILPFQCQAFDIKNVDVTKLSAIKTEGKNQQKEKPKLSRRKTKKQDRGCYLRAIKWEIWVLHHNKSVFISIVTNVAACAR